MPAVTEKVVLLSEVSNEKSIGHWLRLAHLSADGYPSFPTMTQVDDLYDLVGSTAWRSLECEDKWGINAIYNGTSSAPPIFVSDVHHHTNRPNPNLMSIPRVSMLYQNVPNPAKPDKFLYGL